VRSFALPADERRAGARLGRRPHADEPRRDDRLDPTFDLDPAERLEHEALRESSRGRLAHGDRPRFGRGL
jgi:hypothetical protein